MNVFIKDQENTLSNDTIEPDVSPPIPGIHIDQLFKKHHVSLIRFTQRYVRNIDDAKDVVQATYIEAIRCANRYNGSSQPSTWLFGIALNLARNHARQHYVKSLRNADESLLYDMVDMSADPADLAQNQQLANSVEKMLSKMPQRLRETFELVLEHEANYAEAAEKMRIPIGTVRSRISRIRQHIHAIVD
ncbi:RNA polymerase sigma factor [Actimicrobium sp. CCC2.4]|uniref:RNA polymerase sigma factor n=1 Tax=Actimicrobium sp. CCC2.4 TaxID=3048606 RepID=UPI002AC8F7DB|nr:RNA polymerase sigma factor [Actimicrobium sp. CCC2.4]MEB0136392.1 RNA polymerase sigma factor [Actimicrobium sp. CCC2.4]WPX31211.1 RNA polymerase sigma factor [Actimicrobium sp. CCC2.4]